MAIITFMSDFGHRDHYVAAVKAKIFNINPHVNVVDISHSIENFNIVQASYVLKSVYLDFPKGTVHLASVNSATKPVDKLIAMKYKDHFFVGADNGLFSLLTDNSPDYLAIELAKDHLSEIFPERTVLATASVKIAGGTPLISLGEQIDGIREMLHRQLRVTRSKVIGHVIHVDQYGNLITNITKSLIEEVKEGRVFTISFGREMIDGVTSSYNGCDPGDIFAIFNSNEYLEIGVNSGNASELLGMMYDSMITVSFIPDEMIFQ